MCAPSLSLAPAKTRLKIRRTAAGYPRGSESCSTEGGTWFKVSQKEWDGDFDSNDCLVTADVLIFSVIEEDAARGNPYCSRGYIRLYLWVQLQL